MTCQDSGSDLATCDLRKFCLQINFIAWQKTWRFFFQKVTSPDREGERGIFKAPFSFILLVFIYQYLPFYLVILIRIYNIYSYTNISYDKYRIYQMPTRRLMCTSNIKMYCWARQIGILNGNMSYISQQNTTVIQEVHGP